VTAVLAGNVSNAVAVELSTNTAVLEQVTNDQAAEIFDAIDPGALTSDQEEALTTAVSKAPDSVKGVFESTIDVYASGLDKYVPTGSKVNVGSRRALIAAAAAASTLATGGSTPASRDSRDSSSLNYSDMTKTAEGIARRRARGMGTDVAKRRKKMRQLKGHSMKEQSRLRRLINTLSREISSMAFTLAGSVIVLATLSGQTRKIALIATIAALVLHFGHVLTSGETD
jgi:hypothetical protein